MMVTSEFWSVPRDWDGQECFIVCGGESVAALDLSQLRGRRIVVINSSFINLPDADYLVFSDVRWWNKWRDEVRRNFRGQVIALAPMGLSRDYLLLDRQRSGGLSPSPRRLALWHTTTCAAINLAVHLGARAINLLGLDGKGGWHHEPHPWKSLVEDPYHFHGLALEALVEPLRALGVQAFNSCPDSRYQMFPHKPFEDMIK